ncbi:hypothetical protein PHIN3_281 [Sinorhizobium phage phiN3]|uniref:Uncharacterized protein n=1 Tax=Sinorhizobium phage phiN3 TaxID=1647405 RepID=A0A0F6YR47_9CAUD|nr:hypothetical protein AVT40_gp252 [Sinorhizobium phage phiN3]AKF13544.1 hypothetical protein PHIN3_281 [Sinorhizobium phage phiN3]
MKQRNPMARELSQSIYRKKVVKSKKTYNRKKIAGKRHPGDYFLKAA